MAVLLFRVTLQVRFTGSVAHSLLMVGEVLLYVPSEPNVEGIAASGGVAGLELG